MRGLFIASSALIFATAVTADEFWVSGDITDVVVYPSAAAITRVISLNVPEGEHQIVIDDLPEGLNPTSLRFFGADGMVINATNFRTNRLPPDERVDENRDRVSLLIAAEEELLHRHENQIAALEVESNAARAKLAFLRDLANISVADGGEIQLESLRALSNLVAEESQNALQIIETVRLQTDEIAVEIADLEENMEKHLQELEAAGLPPADRILVSLDVSVSDQVNDEMIITYLIDNARWFPIYEFYLDQETETLDIIRKAGITQDTGEDWEEVRVTLSTANPSRGLIYRLPSRQVKRIFEIVELEEPDGMGSVAYVAPAQPEMIEEISSAFAEVRSVRSGLFTNYVLPLPVTLDGDGAEALFVIGAFQTEVDIYARAGGRLGTQHAYITVDFTNATGAPFIGGAGIYYLDNNFIGSTESFRTISENETTELYFGVIDGLTIRSLRLSTQSGESGIVSAHNVKNDAFEITIENLTDRGWDLEYYRGMPISEQEDLVIDVRANPQPDDVATEKQRGVYKWNIAIVPGEEHIISINVGYEWPLEMRLQ